MIEGRLIRIVWYYLYQHNAFIFDGSFHKNSTVKRTCSTSINFGMSDLQENFLESVRLRIKHVEKTRVGL